MHVVVCIVVHFFVHVVVRIVVRVVVHVVVHVFVRIFVHVLERRRQGFPPRIREEVPPGPCHYPHQPPTRRCWNRPLEFSWIKSPRKVSVQLKRVKWAPSCRWTWDWWPPDGPIMDDYGQA